ncbi:MAG: hypothetical protein CVV51_02130 [Spirochaetae bacterium HGW-Spirochaetae-7]|nr:MAG: hypothetical protein CVV51_02130 [Spirochaetae bacterium HGW-Spirochaetae-7]
MEALMAIDEKREPVVVLLAGYRYAGRSLVLQRLELAGYTCVDNLPPGLVPGYLEHGKDDQRPSRIAVALDTNGEGGIAALSRLLDRLDGQGRRYGLVFLEAGDSALAERQAAADDVSATNDHDGLQATLQAARESMAPIRERASLVLDSSWMSPLEERDRILAMAEGRQHVALTFVELMSFGYKFGAPTGDIVFDARFIPNPYYVSNLRALTGLDLACAGYVLANDGAIGALEALRSLVQAMLPSYSSQGRRVLKVRIGCTGGQHRSVAMAEALAQALRSEGCQCVVRHREMEAGRYADGAQGTGKPGAKAMP